jgi:hypothetical protein
MTFSVGIFFQDPSTDPVADLMANRSQPHKPKADFSLVESCVWDETTWNGKLRLLHGRKPQAEVYQGAAKVADIDFAYMEQERRAKLPCYEQAMFDSAIPNNIFWRVFFDEETFLELNSHFYTFAVYVVGKGWTFGDYVNHEFDSLEFHNALSVWKREYYNRFLKPAIVDGSYLFVGQCRI